MKKTTIKSMTQASGWKAVFEHEDTDGYYADPVAFWAAVVHPDGREQAVGVVAAGRELHPAPELPRFLCYATDAEAVRLIEDR